MTSESDWIKEVSKTYLEEAWKASAVANAGKKPSYAKDKKEMKEEAEECNECIQEQALVESVNLLTEEQQELFVLSFVDDLLESLTVEEIEALTEEQLEEGLMAKLKGYAGGAFAGPCELACLP